MVALTYPGQIPENRGTKIRHGMFRPLYLARFDFIPGLQDRTDGWQLQTWPASLACVKWEARSIVYSIYHRSSSRQADEEARRPPGPLRQVQTERACQDPAEVIG
jgi:hypothetical protein